ncbi:hypothetical protein CPC08DRAFT_755503 [Agrocybe pediades]|nr:hypothetical protein CPC08DRAFT_755503 [Agrocybe pediades]
MSVITNVDDRDPSITYNANHWGFEQNKNELDGTSTFTDLPGGIATFRFSGPSTIVVFGVIQAASFQPSGRSTYSIDGSSPQIYVPSPLNDTAQFNVNFFESSVTSGSHSLIITTLDTGKYVYLDYIQIIPLPSSTSTTRATVASASSSSGTSNGVLSQSSSQSSFTSSPAANTASAAVAGTTHHISLAVIFGPIIGVLAITMIILLGWICYARPRRRKREALISQCKPEAASSEAILPNDVRVGAASRGLVSVSPFVLGRDDVLDTSDTKVPINTTPDPPGWGTLSRFTPGSTSRMLESVSPFVLGGDTEGPPPPYYATKQGQPTSSSV